MNAQEARNLTNCSLQGTVPHDLYHSILESIEVEAKIGRCGLSKTYDQDDGYSYDEVDTARRILDSMGYKTSINSASFPKTGSSFITLAISW